MLGYSTEKPIFYFMAYRSSIKSNFGCVSECIYIKSSID